MQDKQQLNELLFKACTPEDKFINKEAVSALLEAGADPNYVVSCSLFPMASNKHNFPLLHVIASNVNSLEIAELLINYGAELTKKDTCIGNTPLLTAIALGDEPLAKFFIQYVLLSNDPSAIVILSQKDEGLECQNTPIILAVKKDMDEVALMLIEAGADVNVIARNQMTPLHWATMLRKNTLIEALLKKDAKIDIPNRWGYTASDYYDYEIKLIDVAEYNKSVEIINALTSNMQEFSDLYFYVQGKKELALQDRIKKRNSISVDKQLFKALKNNHIPEISLTARHESIVKEQLPLILKSRNQMGANSLFLSDKSLLEAYNNIDLEEETAKNAIQFKNASLSFAFKEKDSEKINALLSDITIDVNTASMDGFTALHWACMQRHEERIKTLMARGADPTLKNKYGRTPIDYYQYEMRAADFEHIAAKQEYETLKKHLASGDAQMPEFSQFTNDPFLANLLRKRKPINLSLFERKVIESTSSEKSSNVKEGTHIPVQDLIKTAKSPVFAQSDTKSNHSEHRVQVQNDHLSTGKTINSNEPKKIKEENYKPIKSKSLQMESFSLVEEKIVFLDSEWIVSNQVVHHSKEISVLNVWDINTGKHINTLHGQKLHTCVGNLKNNRLVCGSINHPLSIWDMNTDQCLGFLGENIAGIKALKVLPNNQVVAGYYDDSIRIWDVNTRQCLKVLKVDTYIGTMFLDMLPNGQLVSVVFDSYNQHGIIQIWDLSTNTFKACNINFIIGMGGMIVLSDDLVLVSINNGPYALQVWDINQKKCLSVLTGHTDNITCMKLLSHHQIISTSYDKTIRIWDWKEGKCLKILQGDTDTIVGIHVLSRDKFLTISQDGSIKTWESSLAFSSAAEIRKNTRTLHEFINPLPENTEWRNGSFFSALPKDLVDTIIRFTRDPEFHTEGEAQTIIESHSCKPT